MFVLEAPSGGAPRRGRLGRGALGSWSPLAASGVCVFAFGVSEARAVPITLANADPPGAGFNDATPIAPVDGNNGTTVGAQRWNVVRAAADVWQAALPGTVPVIIEVRFAPDPPLPCSSTEAVTAAAAPTSVTSVRGVRTPIALGNQRAGEDLLGGMAPHIVVQLNDALGDPARCAHAGKWYYGLTGRAAAEDADLFATFTHELAHGLGFTSEIDLADDPGVFRGGEPDVFAALAVATESELSLLEQSSAARHRALQRSRSVAWSGAATRRAAAQLLARGLPGVRVVLADGEVVLTSELVNETLPTYAFEPVSAPLLSVSSVELCSSRAVIQGRIAVVDGDLCSPADKLLLAQRLGAVGVVIEDALNAAPAPIYLDAIDVALPALTVSAQDHARLAELADGEREALIFRDPSRLLGADPKGRPYLSTGAPLRAGRTLTHVDPLARRAEPVGGSVDLLLEPTVLGSPRTDLGLADAFLKDLGWESPLCGNGMLDSGEECDSAERRSNTAASACRLNCEFAHCGDAATDPGEVCDNGALNSDETPNACRSNCEAPRCGDGVVDFLLGEECDGDTQDSGLPADGANAADGPCTATCQWSRCGDGVTDDGEECDSGEENRAAPNACRLDCRAPRCGDGIVDDGEQCDGEGNGDNDCDERCRRIGEHDAGGTHDGGVQEPQDGGAGTRPPPNEASCDCRLGAPTSSRVGGWVWVLVTLGLAGRRHARRRTDVSGELGSLGRSP